MATVNFSVPDDVKEAFNRAFAGQNKSAVIADLMRRAVQEAARRQARAEAIARLESRREDRPTADENAIHAARSSGRP